MLKAYITNHGDSSVGLNNIYTQISELEVDAENREYVRGCLKRCFSEIYDGRCSVVFSDEKNYEL